MRSCERVTLWACWNTRRSSGGSWKVLGGVAERAHHSDHEQLSLKTDRKMPFTTETTNRSDTEAMKIISESHQKYFWKSLSFRKKNALRFTRGHSNKNASPHPNARLGTQKNGSNANQLTQSNLAGLPLHLATIVQITFSAKRSQQDVR